MKVNSQFKNASLVLGLCILAACSVETKVDGALDSLPPGWQAKTGAAAEGKWITDCRFIDGYYQIEQLELKEGRFITKVDAYSKNGCAGTPQFNIEIEGGYLIGAASPGIANAFDLDIVSTDQTGQAVTTYTYVVLEFDRMYMPDDQSNNPQNRYSPLDRTRPYWRVSH